MTHDIPTLILQGIRDFSASRPRSLQTAVGPSQLGSPCDHCLTAALVGWPKQDDEAWLPLIGTAVHALLLEDDESEGAATWLKGAWSGGDWIKEQGVGVGEIAGVAVWGSADLFHVPSGTVIDLKVVGASTLNEAKRHGPSQTYRVQTQLYGRGFQRAGYDVRQVCIAYLPRNSMRLSDAHFDIRPYDESIAVAALERAQSLLHMAKAIEAISVAARDDFIDQLPRSAGCYDCARYPSLDRGPSELAQMFGIDGQSSTVDWSTVKDSIEQARRERE